MSYMNFYAKNYECQVFWARKFKYLYKGILNKTFFTQFSNNVDLQSAAAAEVVAQISIRS